MILRRLLLWSLPLVLVALSAVLAWLLSTEAGLRFALARITALDAVPVQIDAAHGRLAGPLQLEGLRVELDAVEVDIPALSLDWRPWRLVYRREIRVLALSVESPTVVLREGGTPPPEPPPEGRKDWPEALELPVRVEIEKLQVRGGRLLTGESVQIEDLSLDLAAGWRGRRASLRELKLDLRRGDLRVQLDAEGRVATALAEPQSLDLQWQIELPDATSTLTGTTQLRGPLADLTLDQRLAGLLEARLAGQLQGLPDAPAWSLQLTLAPLAPDGGLWPETLGGTRADLVVRGEVARSRLQGEVAAPGWVAGPVEIDLIAGWQDGVARVETARVETADGGVLRARGQLTPADELAAELVVEAENLGWPLDGSPRQFDLERLAVDARGGAEAYDFALAARGRTGDLPAVELSLEGRLRERTLWVDRLAADDEDGQVRLRGNGQALLAADALTWTATLDAAVQLPEQPPLALDLEARGDAGHAEFSRLRLALLDGTAEGGGRIAWAEGADMDFTLAFREIDPGSHYPGWTGRLAAELALRGQLGDEADLVVELAPLGGQLRNRDVAGEVRVALRGDTLQVDTLRVAVGGAQLSAEGGLGETLDLGFALDADNLNDLMPGAGGRVALAGRLHGQRDLPALALDLEAARLRYAQWFLGALEAYIDVDLDAANRSALAIRLTELRSEDTLIDTLSLEGSGTPGSHTATLDARRGESSLVLEIDGGLDQGAGQWAGRLEDLTLVLAEEIVWALETPSALLLGRDAGRVETTCMDGTLGRVCLAGDWRGGAAWRGELGISALDLEGLTRWLGNGLVATGMVAGNVVVDADEAGFASLGGGLAVNDGVLFLEERPEEELLGWASAAVSLRGDREEARGRVAVALAGDDLVEGEFSVGWNDPELPLQATLTAELGQLALVAELVPDLAALQGSLSARLDVGGSLRAPVTRGELNWRDGAAQLPVLGIAPREINARVELAPDDLRFELSAQTGEGRLESQGRFSFMEGFAGVASLSGQQLLLVDLPEARVLASPDLGLTFRDRHLQINGAVEIPQARITGLVQGTGAVSESPDTVIVGERARDAERLTVGYAVRVNVGPEVRLDVAGLRGRVEGSLLALQGDDGVATGRGEVRVVDGSFGAFGQRLTIEQGRLLFTGGAIDNPGLDIRAVRRVDNITAGAQVRGNLFEPEISVFSDPPMPRAEALSYLTIGKSINDLDSGEQDALNSAANSLALSGGNLLAREIGGRLGFDEVGVAAGAEPGSASLVVGKYLGPRLFVSYGVGLFEAVNELRLRYRLSNRWTLEAASGEQSSADVIFTVER
ncbi:MAG: hypothetical protein EA371_13615 [Gammaproteobacteria bacterium]|nr:MAG: hypothetical protein EA371_13615 [Gammaproteobacteria bacterium]